MSVDECQIRDWFVVTRPNRELSHASSALVDLSFQSPYNKKSSLQSPFLALDTHRILAIATKEVPSVKELTVAFLRPLVQRTPHSLERYRLTTQQKQSACHSAPRALTTISVTGRLHFLHLVEYRLVWQLTHQA